MKVLSRLPFSQSPSVVSTPDGIVEVKPFQIVLMVSLAPRGLTELPKESVRFPAILDTGTNHNFSIREEQGFPVGKLTIAGFDFEDQIICLVVLFLLSSGSSIGCRPPADGLYA